MSAGSRSKAFIYLIWEFSSPVVSLHSSVFYSHMSVWGFLVVSPLQTSTSWFPGGNPPCCWRLNTNNKNNLNILNTEPVVASYMHINRSCYSDTEGASWCILGERVRLIYCFLVVCMETTSTFHNLLFYQLNLQLRQNFFYQKEKCVWICSLSAPLCSLYENTDQILTFSFIYNACSFMLL